MASTDIDGSPILILGKAQCMRLMAWFEQHEHFGWSTDEDTLLAARIRPIAFPETMDADRPTHNP